jgi:hypothetical protein
VLTFLFWNTNRKPVGETISALAQEHRVDLVAIAECATTPDEMMRLLNADETVFHFPFSAADGIQIYTRFSGDFLTPLFESNRASIRRLHLPALPELLLAVVHAPSKLHARAESQAAEASILARRISGLEAEQGHSRTILMGDLNMNPFEAGVAASGYLHGVMSRQVASRGQRRVVGDDYAFFYNPMWGHLGDRLGGPPGTHYYDNGEHFNYFWNVFDQVLIRPSLLEWFRPEDVRVLTRVRGTTLLTANGIPQTQYSDHLPLLFALQV